MAIQVNANLVFHQQTEYNLKLRDKIQQDLIQTSQILATKQVADAFTEPLGSETRQPQWIRSDIRSKKQPNPIVFCYHQIKENPLPPSGGIGGAASPPPRVSSLPSKSTLHFSMDPNPSPCGSGEVLVTIDVHSTKTLMSSGHRYLDVRTVEEFQKGHPEEALNVPYMFFSPQG
ncbi:hypothetical protein IEQ34_018867 [Dendrobium chrysotoxum]|uniref:Rhodanese domain-containing protein n=1 Tax=Dendrobium chrysotoxum TaxID=161865 RepID=A0AAV7G701_DENCH|nr:hypothetical protein IEQ34_018867 [Dendrobium chrysotoxum]